MNNKGEIYQALNDNEKIRNHRYSKGYLHLVEGVLLNQDGKVRDHDFKTPSDWQIYKESKWYENIPAGTVLCWVGNTFVLPQNCIRIIVDYDKSGTYVNKFIDSAGKHWHDAEPCTKQEMQIFMDNVPENIK